MPLRIAQSHSGRFDSSDAHERCGIEPGSVSQVRESASYLTRFAKENGIAVIMVGHVTKDGSLAGPKVLTLHRLLCDVSKAIVIVVTAPCVPQNRFGAINELGVFAMTERGKRSRQSFGNFPFRGEEESSGSLVMWWFGKARGRYLWNCKCWWITPAMSNPRRVSCRAWMLTV